MMIDVQMPALSDPHSVPDVFASGLGEIEDLDGCLRFTLFAEQHGKPVVVARIVVPATSLPAILYLAGKAVGLSLVKAVKEGGSVN